MWPSGNDSSSDQPLQHTVAGITFTHTPHTRARRLSIKVEPSGAVRVVSPPKVRLHTITQFVEANTEWIKRTQKKYQTALPPQDSVLIFGKQYSKKLEYKKEKPLGARIVDKSVVINTPELLITPELSWGKEHARQLESFLDAASKKYITERVKQLATKMQLQYRHVNFKKQSTRWGSCSTQKNLNFNLKLVHAPTAVIDYVIIHELSHLKHMDHSARFWHLVGQYDPEYQVHRGWLKRNSGGMSVG